MKRILSILTAAFVLLSIIALPASASTPVRFYLTGPSSAGVGDTVKYSLHIEGDYEASLLTVKVKFDVGSFSFVEVVGGDADTQIKREGITMYNITQDRTAVSYGYMLPTDPTSVQGVLMEITFTVLSTASSKPKFVVDVESFGLLPVGATQQTPVAFRAEDFTVSISGGSGASTTPIPGPGQFTPAPANPTQNPSNPSAPTAVPTPGPTLAPGETATPAPAATESVSRTMETPATTGVTEPTDPGESAEPTAEPSKDGTGNKIKPVFIIVIAALGVLLAALIVFFVIRSSKEKNRRN